MSIVLRFVNDSGAIVERFDGAVQVQHTKSETLIQELLSFLEQFELDIGKLRGRHSMGPRICEGSSTDYMI